MRQFLVVLGLTLAMSGASAGDLSFKVANTGGTAVTGITATPKSGDPVEPIAIENSSVGPGETSNVTIAAPGEQCVFDLTITAAGREAILRPDVDLCQLEVLAIE